MTPVADRALINPARLDELRSVLGEAQMCQLLLAFISELETRPARIADDVARADHVAARSAAHLFKGAALSIGAERSAWLANALELAPEYAIPSISADLRVAAADTIDDVRRRLADQPR